MPIKRILIHSGKHPFEPFDYGLDYEGMMRVTGRNLGNCLFADALFKYLYAAPDMVLDSDYYRRGKSGQPLSADEINERYDCYVIPAANWLSEESREMLASWVPLLRGLKIPVVLAGIGVQAHGRDSFDFLKSFETEAKGFLSAVAERSHAISVRGEFTAACLGKLGIHQVNVTGCPSFYRNLRTLEVKKPAVSPGDFTVAVNGNKVLLARIAGDLFDRYPSELFSQGDILKLLKGRAGTPWPDLRYAMSDGFSMKLLAQGRVRYFGDVTPWIEALKAFHFSIGTRIHGNILGLLAGIPALVVAHDSRTSEMAEFYRIPCRTLKSLEGGFDPHRLYQELDLAPMLAAYPARRDNMIAFLEGNGLRHTLLCENGTTPFDERIRQVCFGRSEGEQGGLFFHAARAVAPLFRQMKRAKRTVSS